MDQRLAPPHLEDTVQEVKNRMQVTSHPHPPTPVLLNSEVLGAELRQQMDQPKPLPKAETVSLS